MSDMTNFDEARLTAPESIVYKRVLFVAVSRSQAGRVLVKLEEDLALIGPGGYQTSWATWPRGLPLDGAPWDAASSHLAEDGIAEFVFAPRPASVAQDMELT